PPGARCRRARQRQRRGGRSGRGGGPDPRLREHRGQRGDLGGQRGRRGRRGHAAAWDRRGRPRTMSEGSDAVDTTLLGIGTWTKQGPATLVLRESAWVVLVPGLRRQVIEAAWTVLGSSPPRRTSWTGWWRPQSSRAPTSSPHCCSASTTGTAPSSV